MSIKQLLLHRWVFLQDFHRCKTSGLGLVCLWWRLMIRYKIQWFNFTTVYHATYGTRSAIVRNGVAYRSGTLCFRPRAVFLVDDDGVRHIFHLNVRECRIAHAALATLLMHLPLAINNVEHVRLDVLVYQQLVTPVHEFALRRTIESESTLLKAGSEVVLWRLVGTPASWESKHSGADYCSMLKWVVLRKSVKSAPAMSWFAHRLWCLQMYILSLQHRTLPRGLHSSPDSPHCTTLQTTQTCNS